jgi:hypothetical protein
VKFNFGCDSSAFGIPNESFGVDFTQSDSLKTLDKLVGYAHGNGTRVVLSVGGWGGSKFFSVAVKTDAARQTFVNNLYQLVLTHNLDGEPPPSLHRGRDDVRHQSQIKGTASLENYRIASKFQYWISKSKSNS